MRGALLALLCALPLSVFKPAAFAQSEDGAPPGYREAISAAIQEFDAQSYAEAREQFRRAHKLFPNARTLRGLGVAEYELHNYPEAVRNLEQALAAEVKPLSGSLRAETEAVLSRARGYVGTVQLAIDPNGARVLVDNERVEDAQEALLLPVGDHVIDVSAPGRLSERRAITVQGGQTQLLKIELSEVEVNVGAAPPVERPTPTPVYKRWWLWTTVAVVAGGAATAAVLLTRKDKEREVAQGSDNTPPGGFNLHPFAVEIGR